MDAELLNALELAKAGSWSESHEIVQTRNDAGACLVHAYLHRVEGDVGNARYWYDRAGEPFPTVESAEELEELIQRFNQ